MTPRCNHLGCNRVANRVAREAWSVAAASRSITGPWPSLRLSPMRLVVHLPEDLARRLEAAAAERGLSPEEVAVEAIEASLSAAGG